MSKSNTVICAAKKCYSSIVTHPEKSFFGFPSDISLCKIWLENCGRTDLNLQQVSKRSHWRLCEDHFDEKWFTDYSKKILKRKLNPIPTIFLSNINSLLPPSTEPDSIDVDDTLNPADSLCMELVEENSTCEYHLSLTEPSSKTQCLPISYHSKQLLNSVEFSDKTEGRTLTNYGPDTELNRIDQMCRFCLNNVSCNYIEMFSETDDAKEIRKISETILPNKISVCDGLPHKVCQQCIVDLKTCQRLMGQFQNADKYLRAIAKYSLFIENEDTTEEEAEDKTNDNDSIIPIPKTATVLPFCHLKESLQGCYGDLDEINIDTPLEEEDDFNLCNYTLTPNNSNESENSSLQERERNGGSLEINSSNVKKQILNHSSKFYKNCNKLPSQEFNKEIIVFTQGYSNHDPRVVTRFQTFNFGIVKPKEEIIFTGVKCSHCSELFNSDTILEEHIKNAHDT